MLQRVVARALQRNGRATGLGGDRRAREQQDIRSRADPIAKTNY